MKLVPRPPTNHLHLSLYLFSPRVLFYIPPVFPDTRACTRATHLGFLLSFSLAFSLSLSLGETRCCVVESTGVTRVCVNASREKRRSSVRSFTRKPCRRSRSAVARFTGGRTLLDAGTSSLLAFPRLVALARRLDGKRAAPARPRRKTRDYCLLVECGTRLTHAHAHAHAHAQGAAVWAVASTALATAGWHNVYLRY